MEDTEIKTWECPNCHSTGNSGRFCTKCGTEKPVVDNEEENKETKKTKSNKVIETIIAIAMIIFFSISLVLVLSPMMIIYDSSREISDSVNFYYFFYTVWANLKVSSNTADIVRAIVSTIAFIGGVGAVYYFGISGLIDSIKVVKNHKDPQYAKPMMGVIGAMFSYYSIVAMLYTEIISGNGYYVNNSAGSAIAFFTILIVMVLIALMARSFVIAIIDKKPFRIASSIIKFVSIIFLISAVLVSSKLGMSYASKSSSNSFSETLTFFNWTVAFLSVGSSAAGITTLIGAITTVLALVSGIGSLCLGFGSLIDEKHDKKASILSIVFCGLLFVTIGISTATFFLVNTTGSDKFVPYNIPAAIILSLLGIIGIVVASALEKEKKVD